MFYSPEEREHIAHALRKSGRYSQEEVARLVHFILLLAPEIIKVWARTASKPTKLAPPQRKGGETKDSHPP